MRYLVFLIHLSLAHYRCRDGREASCSDDRNTVTETTTIIVSPEFDNTLEAEKLIFSSCSAESRCTCADGSTPTSTRVRPACADSSQPDCAGSCPDGSDPSSLPRFLLKLTRSTPCPDDTYPIIAKCVCKDGSPAVEVERRKGGGRRKNKSKCEDRSFPTCLGACDDGSDATLDGDRSTEPCQDGSRPDKSVCVCQDGSSFKGRGGKIRDVVNKIKDFFG